MGDRGNAKTIKAKVPLSEMFGYATDLRSTTQGRASYTMQFDSYEAVPRTWRGNYQQGRRQRLGVRASITEVK